MTEARLLKHDFPVHGDYLLLLLSIYGVFVRGFGSCTRRSIPIADRELIFQSNFRLKLSTTKFFTTKFWSFWAEGFFLL